MVKKSLVCKQSGFWMGSELQKVDHLESGRGWLRWPKKDDRIEKTKRYFFIYWPFFHNRQYCKHLFSVILKLIITFTVHLKNSPLYYVYSPLHFRSCYQVIFGHLYSVKLTGLIWTDDRHFVENHLKSGQQYQDFKRLGFQMIDTLKV